MVLSVVVINSISSICAYGMRRYKFREIKFLYYLLLTGFFIPDQVIILPLFKLLKLFHLIDTLLGLIVVYAGKGLAFAMMLYVGFYKSIPKELDESSMIDGCGPFRTYWRILLPLTRPVIATVTILSGLAIWRDFFIPLVLIITPSKKGTLALGMLRFMGAFSIEWTKMCAAMVIHTVPIIILFLLLQKYFVSGIITGSVKG
jgi:raffinose/stachyose/melibiose transport system permease protein